MVADAADILAILRDAANQELLPRYRRLQGSDIRSKAEATDLVTAADEAVELYLEKRFAALMPSAVFIGEEIASADPSILDRIADLETTVVVDPLDGTANFVAGIPAFGIMAAVLRHGEAVTGILYDPMGDDWVIAERGSGAFFACEGGASQRLVVANAVPLTEMVGYVSTDYLPAEIKPLILANLAKPRMFSSHRCAAHMYRAFARGQGHFIMLDRLAPWDHLAGALAVTEAGGHVACLDGTPYDARKRAGAIVASTDPESWRIVVRNIF